MIFQVTFVLFSIVELVSCGQRRINSPAYRLMDDIMGSYNKIIRPVYNDSEPVHVVMHLWFKQVLKVDEIDQILTIYCWTEQHWNDQYLTWNPEDYDGVSYMNVPAERIWRPDILVYNNADMNIDENELSTNVVLNHTGGVMYFRAVISKVTCNLDMTYFPFDKQHCHMMFASWSYDGGKVVLRPRDADNNLEYYIENTEWKLQVTKTLMRRPSISLQDFGYGANIKYYDCCSEPFPDVTYHFVLERNPSYYILNLIIPSVFITVVTMVGFFTPYSSTGENTEKVSLGVTALLSLAIILLMVADKMPATSKVIPLIGKYYIGLIWLIFAATIITTVTLRLQSKGNAGKPLAPETKKLFFQYVAKMLLMNVDLPPRKINNESKHSTVATDRNADTAPLLLPGAPSTESFSFMALPSLPGPSSNTTQMDPGVMALLRRIRQSLKDINGRLGEQRRDAEIRKEWEQLARITERMLMIFFILGTVAFASVMFFPCLAQRGTI